MPLELETQLLKNTREWFGKLEVALLTTVALQ